MAHSQRIYRCVLVHNSTTGTLITSHKEDLLREISHQLVLGVKGLAEEDMFLLECSFDKLVLTNEGTSGILVSPHSGSTGGLSITRTNEQVSTAELHWNHVEHGHRYTCAYYECICSAPLRWAEQFLGDDNILEGESPLSAVLTATLFCSYCLRRMKAPFG